MRHILHDEHGSTLYGADYENKLTSFAYLKGTKENNEVEKASECQMWEDIFLNMWNKFKVGDFEGATEQWNDFDPQNQKDFLRDRRSRRYLDNWLGKL